MTRVQAGGCRLQAAGRRLQAGSCWAVPAVVGPPVAGDGYELQEELHTGEPVEDLGGLPVESQRAVLDEELHHLHHLFVGIAHRLGREGKKGRQTLSNMFHFKCTDASGWSVLRQDMGVTQ